MKTANINSLKLGVGIILVVIGAILMADGVVCCNCEFMFFPEIHPAFKFIVRFIAVVTATPQIQESKK